MAHHTIIYGRISGTTWKTEDYYKLHRLNKEIIDQLPENDSNFPWINRSMFSIPNEQGVFRDQVITFGASYKTLEHEWDLWINKFEELLKKLFWSDVSIHAEFEVMGNFQYNWLIDLNLIEENNWYEKKPKPITQWTFKSSGPRKFEL